MRLIILLFLCSLHTFSFELQRPMVYDEKRDKIDGWFMSEKLDGIRAYWDGKKLYTKNKNEIFAPSFFTKDFPPFELDGELWTKRADFENIQSIVLNNNSNLAWENITYNIFEVPNATGNFKARLDFLKNWLDKNPNNYIKIIPQIVCKDENHLQSFLKELLEKKAEGVIVKNPNLEYEVGRSKNSLKVKRFLDDEGIIQAYNLNSNGSLKSLVIKLKSGEVFNLGNGFSKKYRENPPKIGETITFKYYGFTKNGKPKFASFLRVREDK